MKPEPIVIPLSGRIDSTVAPETEKRIFEQLEGSCDSPNVPDASGLDYIARGASYTAAR